MAELDVKESGPQAIYLQSWKNDYLLRAPSGNGVTTGAAGAAALWVLEPRPGGKVVLRSAKGDYLTRTDAAQGVTTGPAGAAAEWTLAPQGQRFVLRSYKGDGLHRPDSASGVTTWSVGVGNEWTLSRVEKVLWFGGTRSLVDIGIHAEHKARTALTLEAWVYATSQRKWAGILSRIHDTGDRESGYGLLLDGASGVFLGLRTSTGKNFYYSSGPDTLKLNAWQHVAATYDGAQIVIYIDGQPRATAALTGEIDYDPDNALTIGAFRDDNEYYGFPGAIAEVRVWSVARSPDQIRDDMRRRLRGEETGMVGYWRLDEGDARDRTGYGRHGRIVADAAWKEHIVPFPPSTGVGLRSRRPNILLIVADDCGVDLMRSNARGEVIAQIDGPGGARVGGQRLPNFEKLVRHGVRFAQAWAHPVCAPSRASLFTGLHPWRHGIGFPSEDCILPETRPNSGTPIQSLAEVIGPAGYKCGMFGKWDLGPPEPGAKRTALDWGWDHYEGLIGGGLGPHKVLKYGYPLIEARGSDVMKLDTLDSTELGPFAGPTTIADRQKIKPRVRAYLEQFTPDYLAAQRDIRYFLYKKDYEDRESGVRRYEELPTERTHLYATKDHFMSALKWIEQQPLDRPWCVAMTSIAPHAPYHIPPQEAFTIEFTDRSKPTTQELLIAQLQSLDHYMGALINAPEIREQMKNTVILFVADNGTQDDDPDTREGDGQGEALDDDAKDKGTYFIGGCHVPMAIADGGAMFDDGPCYLDPEAVGLGGMSLHRGPVHIVDLFATCVEIAGATPPADIDAVSLVPHVRKVAGAARAYNFSQQFAPFGRRIAVHASISDGVHKLSCSRTKFVDGSDADDYKYVFSLLGEHESIPGALRESELESFYDDEVHLAAARRLHAELERYHLTPGHAPKSVAPRKFPRLAIPEVAAYRHVRLVALSEVDGGPWTSVADFRVLADGRELDRAAWQATADSEAPGHPCKGAIDPARPSMWHTQIAGPTPAHPHWIAVDLQAPHKISGFVYQPRQDTPAGRIARYAFQVSNDDENWTTLCQGRFPNTTAEQTVSVLAPNRRVGQSMGCRYVRLVAKSEVGGNPWTAVEDFQLLIGDAPIDRADWGVTVDSHETTAEDGDGGNAIDGKPGTCWVTQWQAQAPRHPHWLTVDLQSPRPISGFRYVPRQSSVNGRIADYEVHVSNDGQHWTSVANGRFPDGPAAQTTSIRLPQVL